MPSWTALTLALLLAAWPAAAEDARPAKAPHQPEFSAVILQETSLRDATGAALTQLRPYAALPFLTSSGQDLLVLWRDDTGKNRQARLSSSAAALVLGSPSKHLRRLKRIQKANLPPEIKSRLMAGRIAQGDNMWQVEMAWGLPERSFMVNYFNDEQHFVYLTPRGKPILLRFVAGALQGPLPASTRAAAAQVESPLSPR